MLVKIFEEVLDEGIVDVVMIILRVGCWQVHKVNNISSGDRGWGRGGGRSGGVCG